MNFQFLNRTPSLGDPFMDQDGIIRRQIENIYRLSNVYHILTMPPQQSATYDHPGRYQFLPISHRESLSPDRFSRSPRSENDSEPSKFFSNKLFFSKKNFF